MDAALASLRRRQAARVSRQADDMNTGGTRYDTTDSDGGDAITTVSV